ncbi:unnamed protein product [Polarella glacialis]|uniref:EF-hand domain-containing protein n=1 Tax=Polarella glacialis TaxID=89957 RepID=A0A813JMF7_POLGL|nr:unnamed protein product [Polarella glacialis]
MRGETYMGEQVTLPGREGYDAETGEPIVATGVFAAAWRARLQNLTGGMQFGGSAFQNLASQVKGGAVFGQAMTQQLGTADSNGTFFGKGELPDNEQDLASGIKSTGLKSLIAKKVIKDLRNLREQKGPVFGEIQPEDIITRFDSKERPEDKQSEVDGAEGAVRQTGWAKARLGRLGGQTGSADITGSGLTGPGGGRGNKAQGWESLRAGGGQGAEAGDPELAGRSPTQFGAGDGLEGRSLWMRRIQALQRAEQATEKKGDKWNMLAVRRGSVIRRAGQALPTDSSSEDPTDVTPVSPAAGTDFNKRWLQRMASKREESKNRSPAADALSGKDTPLQAAKDRKPAAGEAFMKLLRRNNSKPAAGAAEGKGKSSPASEELPSPDQALKSVLRSFSKSKMNVALFAKQRAMLWRKRATGRHLSDFSSDQSSSLGGTTTETETEEDQAEEEEPSPRPAVSVSISTGEVINHWVNSSVETDGTVVRAAAKFLGKLRRRSAHEISPVEMEPEKEIIEADRFGLNLSEMDPKAQKYGRNARGEKRRSRCNKNKKNRKKSGGDSDSDGGGGSRGADAHDGNEGNNDNVKTANLVGLDKWKRKKDREAKLVRAIRASGKRRRKRARELSKEVVKQFKDVANFMEQMLANDEMDREDEEERILAEKKKEEKEMKEKQQRKLKMLLQAQRGMPVEDEMVDDKLDGKQCHDYEWPMTISGIDMSRFNEKVFYFKWDLENCPAAKNRSLVCEVRDSILKVHVSYRAGWLAMSNPAAFGMHRCTRGSLMNGLAKLAAYSKEEAEVIFLLATNLEHLPELSVAAELGEREFLALMRTAEPMTNMVEFFRRLRKYYGDRMEHLFDRFDKDRDGHLSAEEFAKLVFSVGGLEFVAKRLFLMMAENCSRVPRVELKVSLQAFLLSLNQAPGLEEAQRLRRLCKMKHGSALKVLEKIPEVFLDAPIMWREVKVAAKRMGFPKLRATTLIRLGRRNGGGQFAWMEDILLRVMAGFGHHLRSLIWELTARGHMRHGAIRKKESAWAVVDRERSNELWADPLHEVRRNHDLLRGRKVVRAKSEPAPEKKLKPLRLDARKSSKRRRRAAEREDKGYESGQKAAGKKQLREEAAEAAALESMLSGLEELSADEETQKSEVVRGRKLLRELAAGRMFRGQASPLARLYCNLRSWFEAQDGWEDSLREMMHEPIAISELQELLLKSTHLSQLETEDLLAAVRHGRKDPPGDGMIRASDLAFSIWLQRPVRTLGHLRRVLIGAEKTAQRRANEPDSLAHLFRSIPRDANKKVHKQGWVLWLAGFGVHAEDSHALFQLLDQDTNGNLSSSELDAAAEIAKAQAAASNPTAADVKDHRRPRLAQLQRDLDTKVRELEDNFGKWRRQDKIKLSQLQHMLDQLGLSQTDAWDMFLLASPGAAQRPNAVRTIAQVQAAMHGLLENEAVRKLQPDLKVQTVEMAKLGVAALIWKLKGEKGTQRRLVVAASQDSMLDPPTAAAPQQEEQQQQQQQQQQQSEQEQQLPAMAASKQHLEQADSFPAPPPPLDAIGVQLQQLLKEQEPEAEAEVESAFSQGWT